MKLTSGAHEVFMDPTHFKNTIFHTFSILNLKTLIPSLIFIFPKLYSWNTMQKTSAKHPLMAKNKN